MRQAVHIFQKDVRYLWTEIGLVSALAVVLARNPGTLWASPLLIVGAVYLIARLILAEPIPGNNQFWTTRPYRWESLVGAKVLFILAFVNLPIFLAQAYILHVARFSPAANWAGLLWSQTVTFLCVWLPVGALAAVTPGIVPFIFSAFLLATAGFIGTTWMNGGPRQWPVGIDWILDSVGLIALAASALVILYMQYRKRRTYFSRVFAIGAMGIAALAYTYLPAAWAMGLEAKLSRQPRDLSSLQLAIYPDAVRHMPGTSQSPEKTPVDLPLVITGIPGGIRLQIDSMTLTFRASDGRTWKTVSTGTNRQSAGHGMDAFDVPFLMDTSFLNAEGAQGLTLDASLYLTPFGNARAETIPLQTQPVEVLDGLKCSLGRTGVFNIFACQSAFRWPERWVNFIQGATSESLNPLISYSPFPAGITFDNLVEVHSTSRVSLSQRMVTITAEEPLGHFRRDFEISGIRLSDFAAAQK